MKRFQMVLFGPILITYTSKSQKSGSADVGLYFTRLINLISTTSCGYLFILLVVYMTLLHMLPKSLILAKFTILSSFTSCLSVTLQPWGYLSTLLFLCSQSPTTSTKTTQILPLLPVMITLGALTWQQHSVLSILRVPWQPRIHQTRVLYHVFTKLALSLLQLMCY